MNFDEILKLKDRETIDSISGKVVGVYDKEPTPAQKNKGISPQEIVLQDENGVKIRCKINSEGMHLPQDARGRYFKFEGTPNERGNLSGLSANVFNGKHTVNVFKDAVITGDRAIPEASPSPVARPRPKEVSMSGPVGRVDIDDHVSAICSMVRKVDAEMAGAQITEVTPEVYADFLVRLATTVYIQTCKDNLIRKREAYVPVKLADAPKAPNIQEIVDLAMDGKLTAEDFAKYDAEAQYNWEEIYEEVADRLKKRGHDADAIEKAYDDAKAHYTKRTKNFKTQDFCKVVLQDVGSFVEAVETAHETLLSPESTRAVNNDTSDIPF